MSLAIDGIVASQSSSTNAQSLSLTTASANEVICVLSYVETAFTGNQPVTVTSVSASGLTFTKRVSNSNANTVEGSGIGNFEMWYAIATTALSSAAITVSYSNGFDDGSLIAFGVTGANLTTPFDTNSSLPKLVDGSGSSYSASATISTTSANTLLISAVGSDTASFSSGPNPPSGWSMPQNSLNTGGNDYSTLLFASLPVSSAQSSQTYSWPDTFTDQVNQPAGQIYFDAIQAASVYGAVVGYATGTGGGTYPLSYSSLAYDATGCSALVVFCYALSGGIGTPTCTYGSQTCTFVGAQTTGSASLWSWYLDGPTTGSHTLTISLANTYVGPLVAYCVGLSGTKTSSLGAKAFGSTGNPTVATISSLTGGSSLVIGFGAGYYSTGVTISSASPSSPTIASLSTSNQPTIATFQRGGSAGTSDTLTVANSASNSNSTFGVLVEFQTGPTGSTPQTYNVTETETGSAVAAVTASAGFKVSVTEARSATDTAIASSPKSANASETLNAVVTAADFANFAVPATESRSATASASVIATYHSTISETRSVTIASTVAATLAVSVAEAGAASDHATAADTRSATVSDALSAVSSPAAAMTAGRTASETESASDHASAAANFHVTEGETLSAVSSTTPGETILVNISELLVAMDHAAVIFTASQTVSEVGSASDRTTVIAAFRPTISEIGSASDHANAAPSSANAISDILAATSAQSVSAILHVTVAEIGVASGLASASNHSSAVAQESLTANASAIANASHPSSIVEAISASCTASTTIIGTGQSIDLLNAIANAAAANASNISVSDITTAKDVAGASGGNSLVASDVLTAVDSSNLSKLEGIMSTVAPYLDARTLIEAAEIIDPSLILWANENFQQPDPSTTPVWLAIDAYSPTISVLDLGADAYSERGSIRAFINVPVGVGSVPARQMAKNFIDIFRGLGPRNPHYLNASINDTTSDDGNWYALVVTVDFVYEDTTAAIA